MFLIIDWFFVDVDFGWVFFFILCLYVGIGVSRKVILIVIKVMNEIMNISFFFLVLFDNVFYIGVNMNDMNGWILEMILVCLVGRFNCL